MAPINRRAFIQRLTAGAGAISLGAGGCWALDAPTKEWAFPLLGDLHFDHLDHHDHDWLKKEHPNDISQVESYSRISREVTPKLLEVIKAQVKESRAPVPFVVQLGDLIEGLCGSAKLATKQANEALDLIKKIDFQVPFLFTKGNHDVTGPGATEVYDKLLVPFMADDSRKAAFSRTQDQVLLVFYDAYNKASLDWFADLLEKKNPKRLLFVIHPPVVPYNARSTWHIYSSPKLERERARLLNLLGEHRAIVLSGHLHKYSYLVRRTEKGRFVQMSLSSVGNTGDVKTRDLIEDVKGYGPDLVKLEPKHSPTTEQQRRAILETERPFIEHFEYADTWGHAMIQLKGEQIIAAVYRGMDRQPWKTLDLTKAL